ncbi:DNA-directed RNA polymerase subunit H [Candidatus Woesearchaeota archaeon]|nr:DNA-directed RNA polymerase subunit H [Candidatus Woesearchaeota archaeon]
MKKQKFKVDKHILTPKHIKLGEREKAQLLEKYHVTSKELPKILKTDASIKDMDVKIGDIIKIMRKSETAGESAFYRAVSDV